MSRALCLALAFAASAVPAAADESPSPIPGIGSAEIDAARKIFQNNLSNQDVEALVRYLRSTMAGQAAQLAPEVKSRLRKAFADLRLEYGLQLAILFEQLKRRAPGLVDGDFDQLLERLDQALSD